MYPPLFFSEYAFYFGKKSFISARNCNINILGVVPDDEFIITQTNKGEPAVINKKAPSGKAYLEIARRILGENIDVTIPGRDEGFFTKIKGIFRKK
jgi:septum site-determining protein MinD